MREEHGGRQDETRRDKTCRQDETRLVGSQFVWRQTRPGRIAGRPCRPPTEDCSVHQTSLDGCCENKSRTIPSWPELLRRLWGGGRGGGRREDDARCMDRHARKGGRREDDAPTFKSFCAMHASKAPAPSSIHASKAPSTIVHTIHQGVHAGSHTGRHACGSWHEVKAA